MLEQVVKNGGLERIFSHLISVDEVKTYKPSPAAYQLAINKLGVARGEVAFVSSNFFDVAGAKVFGFKSFWLNRSDNTAEELGVVPDATIKSLTDLVAP